MSCPVCNGVGMVRVPMDVETGGWETCPHCQPSEPKSRGLFGRLWRWVQARFRLDLAAVCELSAGRGLHDDFHDYPDDEHGIPMHFVTLRCKRCGKEFCI